MSKKKDQSKEWVNKKIATILYQIEELLRIKGGQKATLYRLKAYQKAAQILENLEEDVAKIYQKDGLKGLKKIPHIGKSTANKIEEFLKRGKIKEFDKLKKETAIRQIITHYFETKGLGLEELKTSAKKRKIVYSRFTKPAKDLLELSGSVEKAKRAITTVANWANTRKLDYAIETVFKKWLELDKLKPKEIIKKPYYNGNLMVWSMQKKKWYVISSAGDWLEFAGQKSEIEWREEQ